MISSGLFVLPGLAHAHAGPAVIFSYFLAGLLAMTGMFSIAELTTAMPKAGGDYFFITRGLGPATGTVAGLLSWFSLSMKSAFALVGMSAFTIIFIDLDIRLISVIFCILFTILNITGVKKAGTFQIILVTGLLLILIIYIIKGVPAVSSKNFFTFFTVWLQ
jgi:basic amino acid/polyamine antiporter, APA family